MTRMCWSNVGLFVTQYAGKYGEREGKDLVHLLGKVVRHSCECLYLARGTDKMPYMSKECRREIHELARDIANCHDCGRKVNYCCRLHQAAVEQLNKPKEKEVRDY